MGVLLGVRRFSGGGIFENDSFEGTMALTDTQIKKAKPSEKAYRMSDSGGMYLWVTPSGGKLWRWGYRFEGKEKLMALGKYPAVSLALARERHGEARSCWRPGPTRWHSGKSTRLPSRLPTTVPSPVSPPSGWSTGGTERARDIWIRLDGAWLPTFCLTWEHALSRNRRTGMVAMVRLIEARGARDIAKRAMETTGQIFRHAIAHG